MASCQAFWNSRMSPTILRYRNYRFFFFSREEDRPHVHVASPEGEAKFWLTPDVRLAHNYRLAPQQLGEVQRFIEEHKDEIARAWNKYFGS